MSSKTFSCPCSGVKTWSYWKSLGPRLVSTTTVYSSGDLMQETFPCHHNSQRPGYICGKEVKYESPENVIMDKMLRKFTKTSAFEVTILFCIWMKKTFFTCSHAAPLPQTMLQNASWILISFQNWKRGRGGYLSRGGERRKFTPREMVGNFQQLLSMINCTLYWVTVERADQHFLLSNNYYEPLWKWQKLIGMEFGA